MHFYPAIGITCISRAFFLGNSAFGYGLRKKNPKICDVNPSEFEEEKLEVQVIILAVCIMVHVKKRVLKIFQKIPGVGPSIAEDLWQLGLRSLDDLKYADPERLYRTHCDLQGCYVDRCVLYVFRCAVYYASTTDPDPDLLKWWNWKDHTKE